MIQKKKTRSLKRMRRCEREQVIKPAFRFVEFRTRFFFFSCRKTLLGPVYGSPIEQIQILPVKSTLELQKRYVVFINRDKVPAVCPLPH